MKTTHQFLASAAFGLEGLVAGELRALDMQEVKPQPYGGVRFSGTLENGFSANLCLRCADRVLLVCGEGEAASFEDLYQLARSVPWERYIGRADAFPVRAKCARSQLMSPSSCQSIVKKAIADRLMEGWRTGALPETGDVHAVDISIHKDHVILSLDTSGEALNRRGYRTWNGEAPLRETLAAALVALSGWRPDTPLYDPCCGTGTLLIEAGFLALDRAPGLLRSFAMEGWTICKNADLPAVRAHARSQFEAGAGRSIQIAGSDIENEPLTLARRHVRQAGLEGRIGFSAMDLRNVRLPGPPGMFIANPPYGERLGDRRVSQAVAAALKGLYTNHPGWKMCVFSADPGFERAFGRRADRKRRLYNGRLECEFLMYAGTGHRARKS